MSRTQIEERLPKPIVTYERQLYRHRSDFARLVFNLALLAFFVFLSWLAPSGLRAFGADMLSLVDQLPRPIVDGIVGVIQLAAALAPLILTLLLLWRRRYGLLALLVLAAVLAAGLMTLLSDWFGSTVPVDQLGFDRFDSWFIHRQFPSSAYLCGATAVLVALGPWLARQWRRAGWIFLAATVASRILTATDVPIRIGMLLTLGAACGSLALVIVGAPRRRVDLVTVSAALEHAGLGADVLDTGGEHDGVPSFIAGGPDGRSYFVKVLGRDERDTDLLLQAWRTITLAGLGDDSPTRSAEGMVQHEALCLGVFAAAGVNVPEPVAVTETTSEASVLVTSYMGGERVANLPAEEITDELLDAIWEQVALLQRRRLAHGRLNTSHIRVVDGAVVLVDLRRAYLDARDEVLGAEVAELVTSLSLQVGAQRSVDAAARALDSDELARAVALLQSAVLSSDTRRALPDRKEYLTDVRSKLAEAAGVEDVELAKVRRITVKGAVSLVGSFVLGYYLISLAASWSAIWAAFKESNVLYVLPILALAMVGYFTGAMSLLGAVTTRLSFLRTTAVMFGQSFLNRFTPANAGGMAMRVRYLQLNGVETPIAAAAIGLTSAASGIAQGILIVVFFIWGGASDRFSDFEMPNMGPILLGILGVGLVASTILYSSWGRQKVWPWVRGAVSKVWGELRQLGQDPGKIGLLLGGPLLGKLAQIVAFWLSIQAFDVTISFPKAGALYMIAVTVGSAVPSPGGVGGIEAALTAVLIGFGVDNATAAAIVLYFRVLTFWLPTIPGYVFLVFSERKGYV